MSDLWRLSAAQIARAVRNHEVSAVKVTQAHLDRLQAVNPAINAVVQDCADEALIAAAAVDTRLAAGEDPGPLAGVPVTIKVNVDQAGHATTNGLRILKDLVAQQDSPVVANLRRAGAIIVGRTNTPAFSLRWFTRNDLHGQTLNPRNRSITPGGSSGGAAAAVASGICAIGHGTDIAGSIRYPAYACGLHGLRPSLGRVPAYNASAPDRFIGAQLMAVSGPIARTVEDVALAFQAMAAADPRDPWYTPAPLDGAPYPRRAALTLAPDDMPVDTRVRDALIRAAKALEDAGWEVEEVPCPPMRAAAAVNATLWMADTRLAAEEMIAREAEPDSQFVFRQMSLAAGPIDLDSVMRALQTRASLVRQWELFLNRYPVLLCPVSGDLPFDQQLDVRSESAFAAVYEAQLTQRGLPVMGMPALSLATGYADGRPVGVQLVSARFREDILLAVGATLEAAGHRPGVSDPFAPG
jgi:amidase